MKTKLNEEIKRNRELMMLNEEETPIVKVSKTGIVNFLDLQNKKVYRYQLVGTVGSRTVEIQVETIDITTGVMTYVNPNDGKVETANIDPIAKEKIEENYKNKQDIDDLAEIKYKAFKVKISLKFVSENPLNVH